MAGILAFVEQRSGRLRPAWTQSMVADARRLAARVGGELTLAVIGHELAAVAKAVAEHGPDRVVVAEHADLAAYDPVAYADLLAAIAGRFEPRAILMTASAMGRDLAPRLAARLDAGVVADCVALDLESDGRLRATRPVYAGRFWATVVAHGHGIQVATLRPNRPSTAPAGGPAAAPRIEPWPVAPAAGRPVARVHATLPTQVTRPDLAEATIVVAGGRGLGGAEHFGLIEALADSLGAAVGASRAVVDAGWRPHAEQVGLTGRTVTPALYIACGISGAAQHQAGMSAARHIVAINNNPQAPIFSICTVGIVGDVHVILPLLIERLKRASTP